MLRQLSLDVSLKDYVQRLIEEDLGYSDYTSFFNRDLWLNIKEDFNSLPYKDNDDVRNLGCRLPLELYNKAKYKSIIKSTTLKDYIINLIKNEIDGTLEQDCQESINLTL